MRVIRNFDVSSYYPSLMIVNGYVSRNIPSFDLFSSIYHKRIEAKRNGDKTTANALKLVLNSTYGATLDKFNPLYDALPARSVCISGQLYLLELAEHLHCDIPMLRIVELNTDGLAIEFDDSQYPEIKAIVDEWQTRTGFDLEEEVIKQYYAKDVNNYVEVGEDGEVKLKGGYLVRGIAPAGAFNINNNACIIAKAITEYFVHGTPVETTINEATDIFDFQLIAKAGSKYRAVYQLVEGQKVFVQKVNRVYATSDTRYGRLYKIKADTGQEAMIESLPDHCLIDNSAVNSPGHTTLSQIDRRFYIEVAKKRVQDFIGTKETDSMAESKKPMNVWEKLMKARTLFAAEGIKKSGTHIKLEFMYYELQDIVPVAQPIFEKLGLAPIVNVNKDFASMQIVNIENTEECLMFCIPTATWEGNKGVNPLQAMGASVTYYRRYLYMLALDICENDSIDGTNSLQDSKPENANPKPAVVTPQTRIAIKQDLTANNGSADSLQLEQVVKAVSRLRAALNGSPRATEIEDWLSQVESRTEGFAKMDRGNCEALILKIQQLQSEVTNG